MKKIWQLWDEFWFAPKPLLNLAFFRILLCLTLFFMYLRRQFDLENFYTDSGLVPTNAAYDIMPDFYHPAFTWFFWSGDGVFWAHLALLIGLAGLVFGLGGRAVTALVWILDIGFLQRNYSLAFGADLIGAIFLLLLIGTQSCAELSVWNLWRKKATRPVSDFITPVFFRMIQVQVCVIYAYSGFEKLKGNSWWDGTALWTVFANGQMVIADLTWLRHFPWIIVALTFSTILFEIYFPILVWVRRLRPYLLVLGLFFHLGIGVSMALMNFTLIMVSPYLLFAEETWLRQLLVDLPLLTSSKRA